MVNKTRNEKEKILNLLIENQDQLFSIRQVAQKRKINYKSAYSAIHKLTQRGIVSIRKIGQVSACSFSTKFDELVFTVELKRRNSFLKNKNFKVIYNRLNKINSPFILLLFGSYVYGTQTKHSDIDFLVVSNDAGDVKKEIDLIPLNIHLTQISYSEFIIMLKSREQTVVTEALKKNIIFFGIEDYYRLIKNAR